jgi:hypothetical protein
LKHEVGWKTILVASNGLVQVLCLNAVDFRKVHVEHDLLASDQKDSPFDFP